VTQRITICGGDQLGLVARLAEVFKQYEANIVRLEARKLSEAGGVFMRPGLRSAFPERRRACAWRPLATPQVRDGDRLFLEQLVLVGVSAGANPASGENTAALRDQGAVRTTLTLWVRSRARRNPSGAFESGRFAVTIESTSICLSLIRATASSNS
jgi:hypothetical protein